MLGRWFRVVRPDDWTGTLARLAIIVAFVQLTILVLLVRLPAAWVALAWGAPVVVRALLLVVVVTTLRFAQALLVARLPRAVVLLGRKIRFHDGTRRRAILVDDVAALAVEQRPPPADEVFVLEARDGVGYDLCPTHWDGAPALHRALERRVASAHRRRARARAAARRSRAGKASGSA